MRNPINPAESGTEVLIFGIIFMAAVFLLAFLRNMESRRIRKKFQDNEILLSAFGVNFYGVDSEGGKPLRSIGALVLTHKGIYYHARFKNRELLIKPDQFSSLSVIETFKGKEMHIKVVAFNFINDEGKRDRAAFRIPYPERWSRALSTIYQGKE